MPSIYIIKSLKWSNTPAYSFQDVYWKDNNNGYTTVLHKAGLYTEQQIMERPNYYNDGVSTLAIRIERESLVSDEEFEKMKEDLEFARIKLQAKESRLKQVKHELKELESGIRITILAIGEKEQELRIQEMMKDPGE